MIMNAIAMRFADGAALFYGLGLLSISIVIILCCGRNRVVGFLANVCCLVALVVVLLSAAPFPMWEYAVLCLITIGFLLWPNLFRKASASPYVRRWLGVLVVVTSVAMTAQEIPYRYCPVSTILPGKQIYVVGDSISAGTGTEPILWPEILSNITGLTVSNLSLPGATVANILSRTDQIHKDGSFVILEIGGNDLLGDSSVNQYRKGLQRIIDQLRIHGHTIVMYELPLFPFKNGYGRIQREFAKDYDITLIPKRYLAKVIGTGGATKDGLHLSLVGHRLLADTTATLLKYDGIKKAEQGDGD